VKHSTKDFTVLPLLFSNSRLLDSVRKKEHSPQALTAKPATAFPDILYVTVILSFTFLLVTVPETSESVIVTFSLISSW